MTDAELDILREAAIGKVRGPRAGEHVTVEVIRAVQSRNGSGWRHMGAETVHGWVDNLDESGMSFMLYAGEVVTAVRFSEALAVRWRMAREAAWR